MLERLVTPKSSNCRRSAVAAPGPRSFVPDLFGAHTLRFSLTLLLLLTSACAAPPIHTRTIQEAPEWFVRLDSFDPSDRTAVQYHHPMMWNEPDLFAILSRMFLDQPVGMMDEPKPAREVFSIEELQHLVAGLRAAFQAALPHEWLTFLLLHNKGPQESVVTSGGLFQEADRLHVVIANHRVLLPSQSKEFLKVRDNPLYSVNGSGGTLGIEPRRFVLATKANWSGGYRASASELVLNYQGYLAHLSLSQRPAFTKELAPSAQPRLEQAPAGNGNSPGQGPAVSPSTALDQLEVEIRHLRQQLADKEQQLERLKTNGVSQPPSR